LVRYKAEGQIPEKENQLVPDFVLAYEKKQLPVVEFHSFRCFVFDDKNVQLKIIR